MWVGTDNGLYQYDKRNSEMFVSLGKLGEIWKIYEDAEGIVWVGTNDGLNRFEKSKVKNIPNNNGNEREDIKFLERSLSGKIWSGSVGKITEHQPNTGNLFVLMRAKMIF